jgi:hypothetical protein
MDYGSIENQQPTEEVKDVPKSTRTSSGKRLISIISIALACIGVAVLVSFSRGGSSNEARSDRVTNLATTNNVRGAPTGKVSTHKPTKV